MASIDDAIDTAVCDQLAADTRAKPDKYDETMDKTYGYDTYDIQAFLGKVCARLAMAGYAFNWHAMDFAKSSAATVGVLEGMILAQTKASAPQSPAGAPNME